RYDARDQWPFHGTPNECLKALRQNNDPQGPHAPYSQTRRPMLLFGHAEDDIHRLTEPSERSGRARNHYQYDTADRDRTRGLAFPGPLFANYEPKDKRAQAQGHYADAARKFCYPPPLPIESKPMLHCFEYPLA